MRWIKEINSSLATISCIGKFSKFELFNFFNVQEAKKATLFTNFFIAGRYDNRNTAIHLL